MDLKEVDGARGVRHPWERTRFEFFQDVLRKNELLTPATSILDIGSGDAWFSSQLMTQNGLLPITCWDQRYTESSASELGLAQGQLDLCNARPKKRFDLILMLDVLEHVEDDRAFLRDTMAQNLRPGGTLLISVPAWEHLESDHDHWLEHFRRYTPSGFRRTLGFASASPLKTGGLFHSLLVPRTLEVFKKRLLKKAPLDAEPTLQWDAHPVVSRLVTTALRVDNRVSRWASDAGLQLPGLSLWALCKQATD
ncbi:MAG: class I SAM-dependent methyltransferase [Myxococcales bacterium]|nr:class I SAM-dependent methyltransferase [Myxococcales bacterium]